MTKERLVHALSGWLTLAIFTVALFPQRDLSIQSDIPRPGTVAARSYISPISFDVPKSASQLKREQSEAQGKVLAVFEYNADATARQLAEFHHTMEQIGQYGEIKALLASTPPGPQTQASTQKASSLYQELSRKLSSTAIHHLSMHASARDTLTNAFEKTLNTGVSEMLLASSPRQVSLYQGYHNLGNLKSLLYTKNEVTLIRNARESTVGTAKIRPRESIIEDAFAGIQLSASGSQGLQSAFYEVLHAFTEPNIFYLEKETESRRRAAAEQVNPSKGMVVKGMEILGRGAIVTPDAIEKLESLARALQSEHRKTSLLASGFGQGLVLLAITLLFASFLATVHTRGMIPIPHFWALISIHALTMLTSIGVDNLGQALSQSTALFPEGSEFLWLQPIVLAPALCTVLFHLRIGLVSALFISVHLGMQANYDLIMSLAGFFISASTILFLHQLRYRSHFLISSILGIIALAISLVVILLLRNRLEWIEFWPALLLGSIAILTSISLVSLFLIHLFERLFGITTNLTLMELSDFNHPLLKRLSENAPGSFHHSIMVGNLAEAAAKRIGANPLLVRVISLYHDIGKSSRPAFFTENQKKGENPHDPLAPEDSMNIIRDHVTEGLRLAKEHKIPGLVSAGIPEHHGDNVIHYFYRKALQQNLEQDIPMDRYRYPGPRPRSKETALVMLADSIEATSRSMEDPDPAALSKLVQDVIQTRLQENQLRESKLSINDLEEIEIGFLQSLEGMFHTRIQYPEGVFISIRRIPMR